MCTPPPQSEAPVSCPFPVEGQLLPVLPALPRVKSPSELLAWSPLPGTGQCTGSKCLLRLRDLHSLELFLPWSCPALQDRPCMGDLFSPFKPIPVRYIFILVLFFQAWKTQGGPSPSPPSLQGGVVDSITRSQLKIRSNQSKHMTSCLGEPPVPLPLGTCPGLRPGCSRGLLSPHLPHNNPG